ncbi:putative reverse transcriptase domain-containing protein [Tanacetum coccineum]
MCSNCQQLDGSKVEGLCCEKCREQEKIGQQLWKQLWATTTPQTTEYWGTECPCTVRCGKCNKVGHLTRNCRVTNPTTPTQRDQIVNQKVVTCFECGSQGHLQNDCPKHQELKTVLVENNARFLMQAGKSISTRGGDVKHVQKHCIGALLDITPYALDVSYAVKLAGQRTQETNTVSYGAVYIRDVREILIVCDENIVRIPYGNEILIVQGDNGDKERKSKLSIISCEKVQKYMEKCCQLFLAQVTVKENKDKSAEKRLEDVPTVRDFPEVFPEDLPGLPPTRQVFHGLMKGYADPCKFVIVFSSRDILIYSKTKKNDVHLRLILELLKKEELYAKFSKCDFWLSRVQFLRHVIDSKGIHVDPAKIESIKDWESPKTPTEIR